MQENTVFSVLNALNCNEHVEKKGSLSYLSVLQKGDKVHVIGRIRRRNIQSPAATDQALREAHPKGSPRA